MVVDARKEVLDNIQGSGSVMPGAGHGASSYNTPRHTGRGLVLGHAVYGPCLVVPYVDSFVHSRYRSYTHRLRQRGTAKKKPSERIMACDIRAKGCLRRFKELKVDWELLTTCRLRSELDEESSGMVVPLARHTS